LFGSRVSFTFPIVKLLDYRARWQDLERSTNPFATVVMAHLKFGRVARLSCRNAAERVTFKFVSVATVQQPRRVRFLRTRQHVGLLGSDVTEVKCPRLDFQRTGNNIPF
jgi:hypothetical protein